jgi:hypothetical protein
VKLTLASGRMVSFAELHQTRTYAGLLAGKPGPRLNAAVIDALMEEATVYGVGDSPRLIPLSSEAMTTRLPRIACFAVLESDALPRSREPYSSLTIIWFQDEFGPPFPPFVIDYVRALNWETSAHAWCP